MQYVKIIAVFIKFCIYVACLHEDSRLNSTMNFQMHKKQKLQIQIVQKQNSKSIVLLSGKIKIVFQPFFVSLYVQIVERSNSDLIFTILICIACTTNKGILISNIRLLIHIKRNQCLPYSCNINEVQNYYLYFTDITTILRK